MQQGHLWRWWGRQIDGVEEEVKPLVSEDVEPHEFQSQKIWGGGVRRRWGGRGQVQSGKNMIGFYTRH